MDTKTKRRNAERVRRVITKLALPLGFHRTKPTFWTRVGENTIEFFHLHLFTFAPKFRVHLGIRVLNDDFEAAALNGPHSGEGSYGLRFETEDSSIEQCATEALRFCVEAGEPWFMKWRDYSALTANSLSPLRVKEKKALADALHGVTTGRNVSRSKKLLGVA